MANRLRENARKNANLHKAAAEAAALPPSTTFSNKQHRVLYHFYPDCQIIRLFARLRSHNSPFYPNLHLCHMTTCVETDAFTPICYVETSAHQHVHS